MPRSVAPLALTLALLTISTIATGCNGGSNDDLPKTTAAAPATTTPTPTPTPSPTSTNGIVVGGPPILTAPLYLRIETAWDDQPDKWEQVQDCIVPEGSPVGTVVNCTGTVDEGKLYFSSLRLTGGAEKSAACPILIFRPYYYKKATNVPQTTCPFDTFIAVNTTVTPQLGDCYDGPATTVVPDFLGGARALYYLTNTVQQTQFAAKSGITLHKQSNRWTVNNLIDHATTKAGYVGGTLQDYVLECRDKDYDLQYKIVFVMSDIDGTGDDFSNWQ